MQPLKFPQHVDDPPNILFWTADDVAPMFGALAVGMLIEQLLYCFILSLVYVKLMRKYKTNTLKGFGLHMMWYAGAVPLGNTRVFSDSYIRNMYS